MRAFSSRSGVKGVGGLLIVVLMKKNKGRGWNFFFPKVFLAGVNLFPIFCYDNPLSPASIFLSEKLPPLESALERVVVLLVVFQLVFLLMVYFLSPLPPCFS